MARNFGLDTPRETRRSLRGNIDPETFGRLSERFARFLGTARFLVYMTAFVLSWVLWNTLAPRDIRFDTYPFIFLTLILSLQASYAAPLILLAQIAKQTVIALLSMKIVHKMYEALPILNISLANLQACVSL